MKVVVVLHQSQIANEVVAFARSVVECMRDNPLFPAPTPALDRVLADADAVAAANATVLTRAKGKREARDVELKALRRDLIRLAHYVQDVADEDPAGAAAIVVSAGMFVKRPSIRTKAPFKAVRGDVAGSARLIAKSAGDRTANQWRYSTDQETWHFATQTLRADTVIDGLSSATVYFFQHRAVTKEGAGAWSDVVSLLIE
jgi:hypothetical protein